MPSVCALYFGLFDPFDCSPLSLYLLPLLFFNSFQYTSLYPLPSHLIDLPSSETDFSENFISENLIAEKFNYLILKVQKQRIPSPWFRCDST
jgi:hypothetical protein